MKVYQKPEVEQISFVAENVTEGPEFGTTSGNVVVGPPDEG